MKNLFITNPSTKHGICFTTTSTKCFANWSNAFFTLCFTTFSWLIICNVSFAQETNADYNALPAGAAIPNKPNVILNLSVETPMQGSAYNDQFDDGELDPDLQCVGTGADGFARANYIRATGAYANRFTNYNSNEGTRNVAVGRCFHPAKEYLGYFDQDKCYNYDVGQARFEPIGATSGAYRICSGAYSGNFMNWATMSSIDAFRYVMTGGQRSTDTTTETVLQRTYINKAVHPYHQWYPVKMIENRTVSGTTDTVSVSDFTPFSTSPLFITKYSNQGDRDNIVNASVKFGAAPTITEAFPNQSNAVIRVLVCDSSIGLEENCLAYEDSDGNITYKPTGLMQEFNNDMRFSLFTYLNDDDRARQGGVMRASMKDIGPIGSDDEGNAIVNPNPEWDPETGIYFVNPNPDDATNSGVTNSGVMNYLNKFGENGYKEIDPVSEMFYECLRYYRNLPPTNDAVNALNAVSRDGYPVIVWDPATDDPIQEPCQKNYIVGLNDVYAHRDKRVPNTAAVIDASNEGDQGSPDNSDALDTLFWTNAVGDHEFSTEMAGTGYKLREVRGFTGGTVETTNIGDVDANTLNLGETFISGRRNSYYAAGLAYWANINDIRPDLGDVGAVVDSLPTTVQTFFVDSQEFKATPTVGPENVLYLAAKYGGFIDSNGNGIPDLDSEWNTTGKTVTTANGPNANIDYKLPDNYAVASNPQAMQDGLRNAFTRIAAAEERAGTPPANLANSDNDGGLLIQALYFQQASEGGDVVWVGQIHAFFVDEFGLFRDDSGSVPNSLDPDDKVFFYDLETTAGVSKLVINRFDPITVVDNNTSGLVPVAGDDGSIPLTDLQTLWSASEVLGSYDNTTITTQRNYTSEAPAIGASRYIFTTLDENFDGTGEQVDFVDSSFANDSEVLILDAPGSDSASRITNSQEIVNFIRGYEESTSGLRSRTEGAGTADETIFRLGDIVNSTPAIVGVPVNSYDTELSDVTYAQFAERYQNRREVLYIGANDGLLHAFNIGFRNDGTGDSVGFGETNAGETAHGLGAELWAYAPHNLLPHLKWLASPTYSHVFYVDGDVATYEAQIFDPLDADHPGGWGTIIVAGMRLGGGNYGLNTDGNPGDEYATRSAYVILDVTNPEVPPVVLAEITDPDLNFTTSKPTLDKDIINGNWSLVFGSGPTNSNFVSDKSAKLFTLDISDLGKENNPLLITDINSSDTFDLVSDAPDSFIGDLTGIDWTNDFTDDVIYFGTVGEKIVSGTTLETGKVFRYLPRDINGTFSGTNVLIDADRPVQSAPLASYANRKQWVYFGTGRFFHEADAINPGIVNQERYYAIQEPDDGDDGFYEYDTTVDAGDLLDTTNIEVSFDDPATTNVDEGGNLTPTFTDASGNTVETTTQLTDHIDESFDGWYRDLSTNGTDPSERVFTKTSTFNGLLFFSTFEPNDNLCEANSGFSNIYGFDMTTGTATGFGIIGDADGDGISDTSISGISGRASEVVLFTNSDSDFGRVYTQQDDGVISNLPVQFSPTTSINLLRRSWREILLD